MEEWKDISGYEGLYQISNFGRVKSVGRRAGKNGIQTIRERMLCQHTDKAGYIAVTLSKYGKLKVCRTHRLVAIAFIENPKDYPFINHKDENKGNPHISNLEWCDNSYNIRYGEGYENRKEVAKQRRKPVIQMDSRGNIIAFHEGIQIAADSVNTYAADIVACCKGQRKTAGKYMWKFA